jgi:HK97 family phage major capsid protein
MPNKMPNLRDIEKVRAEVKARVLRELKEKQEGRNQPAPEENPNARRFFGASAGDGRRHAVGASQDQLAPGIRFARLLRAAALAIRSGYGPNGAVRVLHDTYRDPETARTVEAYQERSLEAGVPTAGGFLVPDDFSAEIIPLLRENTAVLKLGAREMPMPHGNLIIPRHTAGSTVSYVGEAAAASTNATKPALGQLRLSAKIAKAIVAISNQLLKTNAISADEWVRDDLIKALGVRLDKSALIEQGTEFTPRGIIHTPGITDVTINSAVTADTLSNFFKALWDAKVAVRMSDLGTVFNQTLWQDYYDLKDGNGNYYFREEMNTGKLMGVPFQVSQQIPNGTASHNPTYQLVGDFREVIVGRTGQMEIDTSSEAAYKDEGGTLVGAFDNYETLIRLVDSHDIGIRQLGAMAVSDDIQTS